MPHTFIPIPVEQFTPKQHANFWKKIKKTNNCWEWQGFKNQRGYGLWGIHKVGCFKAHRVAYTLLKGEIPADMTIDHLCKNKACVNPEHLEAVSMWVNLMRDEESIARKNLFKKACRWGHEYTAKNTKVRKNAQGNLARMCRICENSYHRRLYARHKLEAEQLALTKS